LVDLENIKNSETFAAVEGHHKKIKVQSMGDEQEECNLYRIYEFARKTLTHSGAIPLDTSPDSDNFLPWHLNSWITLL
jgi:hypothetical protein